MAPTRPEHPQFSDSIADRPVRPPVIVVTGASDGIGREAVRAFACQGATVIMVGRNEAKTVAAARTIMHESGSRAISWQIADLSRQDEVRDLARHLRVQHPRIDVLCNNAGALFLERQTTVDGLEQTFALNHLAYFTLTLELLPSLLAAAQAPAAPGAPARIINVSSRAHQNARIDLDDLQMQREWGGWLAYCNSKLCNVWFTRELDRRLTATSRADDPKIPPNVTVHAMHPGVVTTRFAANNGRRGRVLRRIMDLVSVTPAQGADTLVWLATTDDPRVARTSGGYWFKRREGALSRTARDDAKARSLWIHSVKLSGLDVNTSS